MKKLLSVLLCASLLFSLCIHVSAVDEYDVFVDGVQVTSLNCQDVLGDSAVSYDVQTDTLTLFDATVDSYHSFNQGAAGIYSESDLNIELKGNNTVCLTPDSAPQETGNYGIYSQNALHFFGDGSLQVSAPSYGIYACTGLSFDGCSVEAAAPIFAVYSVAGSLSILGSRLSATASNKNGYGIGNFYGDILIDDSNVFATANFGIVAQKGGKILIADSRVVCAGNNQAIYFENGCLTISTSLNKKMHIYHSLDRLGIMSLRLMSSNYDILGKSTVGFVCIDTVTRRNIESLVARILSQIKIFKAIFC